jgi:hypothetical protein
LSRPPSHFSFLVEFRGAAAILSLFY